LFTQNPIELKKFMSELKIKQPRAKNPTAIRIGKWFYVDRLAP